MVLNPALYEALGAAFGDVKIADENVQLRWSWDHTKSPAVPRVDSGGEQYYICCPICGDTRFRLGIGHRLFTPIHKIHAPEPITHAFRCFNEGCDFREHPEFARIQKLMQSSSAQVGIAVSAKNARDQGGPSGGPQGVLATQPLPKGFVGLRALHSSHPALAFITKKYGFDPMFLADCFSVGYYGSGDPKYKSASDRVIFPIYFNGALVSWQGRAVDPNETKRWYFPTGFKKVLYNWDSLPRQRDDVIVITEGIPASIASGPLATAIFGKELDRYRCELIAQNFRTAVIALDAETQLPDPSTRRRLGNSFDPKNKGRVFAQEISDRLIKAGLRVPPVWIRYPKSVMEAAEALVQQRLDEQAGVIPKVDANRIKVPDPADLGIAKMRELLMDLPRSHRSTYLL